LAGERVPPADDEGTLTNENRPMPYADPERARTYFREYRRMRRGGDECSTHLPAEFRLETAGDVIALIENRVQAVLDDAEAGTLEKALGASRPSTPTTTPTTGVDTRNPKKRLSSDSR
jgi:hypothetical protein